MIRVLIVFKTCQCFPISDGACASLQNHCNNTWSLLGMQNHRAHAHGNVRLCSVAHSLYAIVLWSNFALYVLLNGTILAPRSMQCCIHMASEIKIKKPMCIYKRNRRHTGTVWAHTRLWSPYYGSIQHIRNIVVCMSFWPGFTCNAFYHNIKL